MSHAIDQPFLIEGFFFEQLHEIGFHFVLVCHIGDMGAKVFHHFHHFDVCATVLWAFQAR